MRLLIAALLAAAPLAVPAHSVHDAAPAARGDPFASLKRDVDEFSLVSDAPYVSLHKPMFILPLTYAKEFGSEELEVLFQVSFKQQLFKRNVFFAFTQRSFWQLYNGKDSRPFRETNYDPELFARWKGLYDTDFGLDIGIEHESNGKSLPDSRSWNRLYVAPFRETDEQLAYLKIWYRWPEVQRSSPLDPRGDDNPDIDDYFGWAELILQQKFMFLSDHDMARAMLRGNPKTGKGALQLSYTLPFGDYGYWNLYLFHGYGESLIDYDRSVTRVGVGVALAR